MIHTLADLLARQAARIPEAIAIEDRDRKLAYGEMARRTAALAAALVALDGFERGARVAIRLPKSWQETVAIIGTAGAGLVFVPINPHLKPNQVGHILRDSGAKVFITASSMAGAGDVELAGTAVVAVVDLDDAAALERFGAFAETPPPDTALPASGTILRDLAALIYTSGSTGQPKGVAVTHQNVLEGGQIVSSYLGLGGDERILSVLPFSFDYGLNQLVDAIHTGSTLVLCSVLFPADIVRAVQGAAITVLPLVPHLWIQLLEYLEKKNAVLPGVRRMTNTGGAIGEKFVAKFAERFPDGKLFLMYGLTEAFRSTFLPPEQVAKHPNSIGKAIPGVEILVVDDDGNRCRPGGQGELVHRGALVSMGYWNDPAQSRTRFRPHPFRTAGQTNDELVVFSGDIVRIDEEGFLYYVGRRDNIVKSFGFRINLLEVEQAVKELEHVIDAAVIGHPDERKGTRITALLITADGFDENAFWRAARARLPGHMVPDAIERAAAFPLTPHGKIDRVLLTAERHGA